MGLLRNIRHVILCIWSVTVAFLLKVRGEILEEQNEKEKRCDKSEKYDECDNVT